MCCTSCVDALYKYSSGVNRYTRADCPQWYFSVKHCDPPFSHRLSFRRPTLRCRCSSPLPPEEQTRDCWAGTGAVYSKLEDLGLRPDARCGELRRAWSVVVRSGHGEHDILRFECVCLQQSSGDRLVFEIELLPSQTLSSPTTDIDGRKCRPDHLHHWVAYCTPVSENTLEACLLKTWT